MGAETLVAASPQVGTRISVHVSLCQYRNQPKNTLPCPESSVSTMYIKNQSKKLLRRSEAETFDENPLTTPRALRVLHVLHFATFFKPGSDRFRTCFTKRIPDYDFLAHDMPGSCDGEVRGVFPAYLLQIPEFDGAYGAVQPHPSFQSEANAQGKMALRWHGATAGLVLGLGLVLGFGFWLEVNV